MSNFARIREALVYIDEHLDEPVGFESLASHFHFSPYYFNRMFLAVVGKSVAAHVRDRRLLRACAQLAGSDKSVLDIGLAAGYRSAQSFSRAFGETYGLPPSAYRRQGLKPAGMTVDDMIMKFTNRLKGGVDVNPKIIGRNALRIAGVSGDGAKTGEVWQAFMELAAQNPPANRLSENGYEVRLYQDGGCRVHVGFAVSGDRTGEAYTLLRLPASKYASFDVYVANGYDSENSAMNEWLRTNPEGYAERLLDGAHYCVEYYDERFHGSEAGSVVEIWVPIGKEP